MALFHFHELSQLIFDKCEFFWDVIPVEVYVAIFKDKLAPFVIYDIEEGKANFLIFLKMNSLCQLPWL